VTRRYEAVSGGVSDFFPFVFKSGERVLDIGAGSGRDASRLLALGIDVRAVEPSAEMRMRAMAAHPDLEGRLFGGSLPRELPGSVSGKYHGIILSAVLMHVPDSELFDTAFTVRDLLCDDGKLLVSIPTERGDVAPGQDRDAHGRLMVLRSAAQVKLLFERLGFTLESEWHSADSSGREGVLWTTLFFRYSGVSPRPIDRIESILNADRKVATYKLALLRALCDIALTAYSSVKWEAGGRVGIALDDIAERWIRYYWPLIESPVFLPQINGESKGAKPIAFRTALDGLITYYRRLGGLPVFLRGAVNGSLEPVPRALKSAALKKIASTIVNGPVRFAGGALGKREFSFDSSTRMMLIDANLWRELSLMGHWIRDAVILRWGEMTSRLSGDEVRVGRVLDLLLKMNDPLRADQNVRDIYAAQQDLECVWTGRSLGPGFDVDHAIPFALWQDSSLWNLFPASRSVNNAKRDKLPTRAVVSRREEAIVGCWKVLREKLPVRFQRESAILMGRRPEEGLDATGHGWEKQLMNSFVEAIECTAAIRGASRWEP
jgi:SAM-dependent methyltransferase